MGRPVVPQLSASLAVPTGRGGASRGDERMEPVAETFVPNCEIFSSKVSARDLDLFSGVPASGDTERTLISPGRTPQRCRQL